MYFIYFNIIAKKLTIYLFTKYCREDNRIQNNGTVSGRMDTPELTDGDSQLPDVHIKRLAKLRNFDCISILLRRIRNIILTKKCSLHLIKFSGGTFRERCPCIQSSSILIRPPQLLVHGRHRRLYFCIVFNTS